MGILTKIFASSGGVSDLTNPALWLTEAVSGSATVSGKTVSAEKALALSAYFACIRNVAEDLAKLPLGVYEHLTPRGRRIVPQNPIHKLIHDAPNNEMSAMAFRETMLANAQGWGNGYAEIARRDNGEAWALYPIHPSRVSVKRNADKEIVYEVKTDDIKRASSKAVVLRQDEMFHLHGLGNDGIQGYAVVVYAAESIGGALASQEYTSGFFGNGAHLGVVIEHPGVLKEKARKNLRDSWNALHRGSGKAFSTAILEEGMKVTPVTVPPEHAQFLQTREFQVEDICRWFRMPLNKVQQARRAQGWSTLEQMNTDYVVDTLMPWGVRWEQEIKRKLLPENNLFAKHTFTALLRGDATARGEFFTKMLLAGALSPNDIRELEDMNPIENGDVYVIPLNVQSVDNLAASNRTTPGNGGRASARAYEPVLRAAVERVVRKEVIAVSRAAKRHAEDAEAFEEWLGKFYAEQDEYLYDALAPCLETMCQVLEKPYRQKSDWLLSFAKEQTRHSRASVQAAFTSGSIAVVCADWESVRIRVMVDAITAEMERDNARQ